MSIDADANANTGLRSGLLVFEAIWAARHVMVSRSGIEITSSSQICKDT